MVQTKTSEPQWDQCLSNISQMQDKFAFRRLFNHFGPLIKSFFISKFPDQQDQSLAEELVQEVMLKVWQKAHTYDPTKAAVSTWIFTLARNTHIDMLRRLSKYTNTTSIETEEIWEDHTDNGPLMALQQRRTADTIKHSLRHLPSAQALIIAKVYMDAKSHSEVANELGLPLGTVKSRVRLALSKLGLIVTSHGSQTP
ncbi:MAG: sigma-70 family RNA polymerase sigma factor [Cellvibrionaceae bacterium]|nr:sigma-70 family RNA polymerase sigma factor [Cellvibrionaceae bacterium]